MITIDWQSGIPAYDQIVQGMVRLKAVGAFNAGDQLPSVRSLAVKIGVNPNTVQKAYLILENKGIIYSASGKGSFFSAGDRAEQALHGEALKKFSAAADELIRLGIDLERALDAVREQYAKGGSNND